MHMPHLLCKETFHTSALDYISDKYICNLVGKYISSYGKLEHAMEKISILRFFNTNLQQPTSSFFPGYGTFPISGCFHYRGHYCISRSRSTMHTMCPHMFVGHHQRMEGKISSIDFTRNIMEIMVAPSPTHQDRVKCWLDEHYQTHTL